MTYRLARIWWSLRRPGAACWVTECPRTATRGDELCQGHQDLRAFLGARPVGDRDHRHLTSLPRRWPWIGGDR